MNTPICDFVQNYIKSGAYRLHMPGHKGELFTGTEAGDITEISGADSLFEADGIIRESEKNAGSLFGADTFYSAEGSSLGIRAMLYLAVIHAKEYGRKPVIAAGRNAHKTFINAAAMLDFEIQWIYGEGTDCYLSCTISSELLDDMLSSAGNKPTAVYLTSPDYLGNVADISGISKVCHKHDVLLIVDNAHGAYLKFLEKSMHPIDLGADMCCDSAHKTLPVLTGGAYLHISRQAPSYFRERAKNALSLFASTSPSYLILQSLDMANRYLADGYRGKLSAFLPKVHDLKENLIKKGIHFYGNEPMKLTVSTGSYGYTGTEFSDELTKHNIVCEFCDPDFTVLMLTPETGEDGIKAIETAVNGILPKTPVIKKTPAISKPEKVMSVREAVFSASEELPVSECCGRVLASANISCPPAVPLIVCGERIDEAVIECFRYYGIEKCRVCK